ncbi:MAG: EAL domain-containing protein [Actinomycetota bacterium]|uniref:EAL domain-containing protein n=1 Tax=Mycobacterium lentiflavum TaxID=141349 RepID=A0ABY3UZ80_MYCLN|nr:EAL domain-containing protein [Mycobacterium lentiflavum]MEE3065468.1 EAL domain-containing protein [Actinomycetota bacterium]ULP42507.1 EAL domain-containing protein [Mycobacterium lentiflavum]
MTGGGYDGDPSLNDAVRGKGLSLEFQPIVTLDSGAIVGFEALARWPDLGGAGPNQVFAHARALGHDGRLDQQCVTEAIGAALDARLPRQTLITINYEPGTPYPGSLAPALLARARALSLAFELTERSMLAHPRTLLSTVSAMRRDGFLIALDDVGAQPDSLALLDVLRPDIIKLDMGLVQQKPRQAQARTISAVLAYHERTGTPILAEGIETEAHLEHARALGATLGQGFKFGRSGPISAVPSVSADWAVSHPPIRATARTPYDLAETGPVACRIGRKQVLIALSAHIEAQAGCTADPPIVLATLQHHRYFSAGTRRRYVELAEFCPLVTVFGQDLPEHLGSAIRGVALRPDDPLCEEWTVVALGPQLAVALIARERPGGATSSEYDRQFEFVLTYERRVVTEAAHSLLARML